MISSKMNFFSEEILTTSQNIKNQLILTKMKIQEKSLILKIKSLIKDF